jgi:hypothetical protein
MAGFSMYRGFLLRYAIFRAISLGKTKERGGDIQPRFAGEARKAGVVTVPLPHSPPGTFSVTPERMLRAPP